MTKLTRTINGFIASMMPVSSSWDEEHFRPFRLGIDYPFQMKIPSYSLKSLKTEKAHYPQCHVYTFGEEHLLLNSYEDIDYSGEGCFTISLDVGTRNLYMLLNNDPFVLFGVDVTENNIANAIQISSIDSEPELFMSGIKKIGSVALAGVFDEFPVVYGLARIDLEFENDEPLSVNSVEISGCPDRSYVFGKEDGSIPVTSSPVVYKKEFSLFFKKGDSLKDVFHVYESGTMPVEITVRCTYGGIDTTLVIPVPTLKRNHIHTVVLRNIDNNITSTLHVEKWMENGHIQ